MVGLVPKLQEIATYPRCHSVLTLGVPDLVVCLLVPFLQAPNLIYLTLAVRQRKDVWKRHRSDVLVSSTGVDSRICPSAVVFISALRVLRGLADWVGP